jgi:cyclic beta-1,2-glucan synthetase
VPWGISESAYNVRDLELTYQYSSFGVPGLGLKRGLEANTVIAPYATALATMVDPHAAAQNLSRLASAGACGRYGFYEALDYTASRLPQDTPVVIVRAFMAHHQGMTIVAIADALDGGVMRARFHAEPIVQATELLLQERTPRDVAVVSSWAAEAVSARRLHEGEPTDIRRLATPQGATPTTHILSNGRYTVMLTAAGSGYKPLEGFGGHALARRRHLRRLGLIRLPERCRQRLGLVCGLSAERCRARRLQRRIQGGSRRVHSS